jgi:hypothetical protein
MNGRIYVPTLGRFLQADPHIQAPNNSQSYNRYSYALNNPLSFTDPSGYFFKSLFKGIKKYWRQIASIAIMFTPGVNIIALGFISGYVATGSLKGALIGAFTAGFAGPANTLGGFVANGVVGGLASKAMGGKFGHGFLSAGIGAMAGGAINGIKTAVGRVVASAIVGGTVSKLTGGKFANGAFSAAFARSLGEAKHYEQRANVAIEANTTPEQRAEIEKKLVALNTEITEINKSGGFTSEESAAAWYHEKVHPIGVTYDTEFGAKMFKNLIWNGETLVDKFFLGNVVTQHYSNQVQLSGSQFGSLNAVSKWHTHGNSNVGHTVGADTDWADASKSRSAYVSRGPTYRGSGISLDVWQNGGATTICGVKCNF